MNCCSVILTGYLHYILDRQKSKHCSAKFNRRAKRQKALRSNTAPAAQMDEATPLDLADQRSELDEAAQGTMWTAGMQFLWSQAGRN